MDRTHRRPRNPVAAFAAALFVILAAAGYPVQARAQDTLRAVAVVNDDVISMLDLYMRTRLAALASGIEWTDQSQNRLQRQVLRRLIDERLQIQEAERLGITITDEDTRSALEDIARRNKMTRAQFLNMLGQNQILPTAMDQQIQAELAWRKIVRIRLVPTIEIGDDEIDEVAVRTRANSGGTEYNLAEIYLEVDNPRDDEDVRRSAERLMEQLRDGVPFAGLAGQFSQSATAALGGDMGWIAESQLPEEIAPAARRMQPGQVVGPIRGLTGFHILLLKQRRIITSGESQVRLTQIFLTPSGGGDETEMAELTAKAEDLRGQIQSCADAGRLAAESGSAGSGDLGTLKVADLSPELQRVVETLPVEQPSEPMRLGGGLAILVVCERQGEGISPEKIRENLMTQKLELLARRYMRDLRREANVDLRL